MAQIFETLNNDTFSTATPLGNMRNSPFVRGSLLTGDNFDFFKFQVDVPVQGGIAVIPQGIDANLVLMNSNSQPIRTSLTRGVNTTESIAFDNLPTGEYTLVISKASGNGDYVLSANSTAISSAKLSVTVEDLLTSAIFDELAIPIGGDISGFQEADFYTKVTIDGVTQTSKTFKDNRFPQVDFTASQAVDVSDSKIPIVIRVFDADPGPDQQVDINPARGIKGLSLTYDTLTHQITGDGVGVRREGDRIVINNSTDFSLIPFRGDGDPASISFHVNYNAFASLISSFNNNTPIILGSNASQDLVGQNKSGILCGKGGNDNLSGMGGNDVICGDAGRDTLNGGKGKDICFGGKGRDTQIGGAGKDTFVLIPGMGSDVITDFQDGKDTLGLPIGLSFEVLDIEQRGQHTVIGIAGERLAILQNVRSNQVTSEDFVTVDFTQFQGVEVPTLVA